MLHPMLSLIRRVGRRGAFLLFFAFVDIIYAASLIWIPAESRGTATMRYVADVMPLWAWATIWGVIGLNCLVFAFKREDRFGFVGAVFLKILWGTTFLIGWLFRDLDRGYVSALIWLAFASIAYLVSTWPEPAVVVVVRKEDEP